MDDIERVIAELVSVAVREAYQAGLRDGRQETLDEAARATAEMGSLGRFPSGRKRPMETGAK